MDELLIEEKKYISSKRAAKITGYAKDYIGQLCREGRVPARLVGRSWYVLETAIQDHRFGATDLQSEVKASGIISDSGETVSSTWEPPRYESSAEDFLPPINRLRANSGLGEEDKEEHKASEHLQDAWKTWFDRVAETGTTVSSNGKPEVAQVAEEKPVEIPIHTLYEMSAEETRLPQDIKVATEEQSGEPPAQPAPHANRGGKRALMRAIQAMSILLATIAVALAAISSGYFDKYIISNSQANIILGIKLYNK